MSAHLPVTPDNGVSAPRALLVISAQPTSAMRARVAAGEEPRRDYDQLQAALDADILFPDDARGTRIGRFLARRAGVRVALAWAAFTRRHDYDVIYTDGENVGLPLALLLKYSGARPRRPRHIMLTHYLSTGIKRLLFRLGAGSRVDTLIVHSSAQRELAIHALHMPRERVALLPYFADDRFWRPIPSDTPNTPDGTPTICAVGLEFRDYGTLAAAVRDLDVNVRIAAASHWSHHSAFAASPELPPNLAVNSYTYLPLRELYNQSRFVVVPLHDVDNQAGITVILEAMAMGKAVVVTATRGQTDVIRDPRNDGRGPAVRAWWPGFVDQPEVAARLAHLPTGLYAPPNDPADLRRAIQHLLDHPTLAEEMGRNGRYVLEELFTLDAFTQRFAAVIRGEPLSSLAAPAPTVSQVSRA